MTVIIRNGCPKSDEPHIFRCRFCSTIFKTDEYDVKPDYRNGTYFIAVCPVCGGKKAYEE